MIHQLCPVGGANLDDALLLQLLEVLLLKSIVPTQLGKLQKRIQSYNPNCDNGGWAVHITHPVRRTLEVRTPVVITILLGSPLHHPSKAAVRARDQWKAAQLTY